MSRIRVLPDNLINQIAAGEVIERPSSVVKELIENALDAGARSIEVDVEAGGRRRLRVGDDGHGMDADDALLAMERHATSKLADESDLEKILTLGFRGEALPAIASVSRLTLTTSRDGSTGTRIEVEGGKVRDVRSAGHPRGTTVDVRDLFFNVPARAKFLRAISTELGHISDVVCSSAVAHFETRFTLSHEGRRLVDAPACRDVRERLRQVYRAAWEDAIPFDGSAAAVKVHGYIAPIERATGSRRNQHVHVNGRVVRDRLLAHAIVSACEEFLPKDRHAQVFLFLECDPGAVDVNVHPAKAEVRFREGRMVHDLVRDTVRAALHSALPVTPLATSAMGIGRGEGNSAPAHGGSGQAGRAVQEMSREYRPREDAGLRPGATVVHADAVDRGLPMSGNPPSVGMEAGLFPGAVLLGHYRQSYILAEDPEGLLLIDQHAAHERIIYERLLDEVSRSEPAVQGLMFPVTLNVPRVLAERLDTIVSMLGSLGFDAEPFGDASVVVRGVPGVLDAADPSRMIADLIDAIGEEDPVATPDLQARDRLMATVACHAAVKVRMPLTVEKMNYLINGLFRTRTPLKCPHGRPAVLRFDLRGIERSFGRP